jgi:DNA-binding CsgD family transcriptional regulator
MTQPEKSSADAAFGDPGGPDDGSGGGQGDYPGPLGAGIPAAIFLVITLFLIVDIASDLAAGTGPEHLIFEFFMTILALSGIVVMWRQLRGALRRARDLEVALDGTRADLRKWRSEAQELLRGLGAAIDRQFDRWGLSPAEREVGLLLLKGLSLKEAAEARQTSERTVRQQALAVYRKAGLAGRAELAAFFLEDLLLPRDGGTVASSGDRG